MNAELYPSNTDFEEDIVGEQASDLIPGDQIEENSHPLILQLHPKGCPIGRFYTS